MLRKCSSNIHVQQVGRYFKQSSKALEQQVAREARFYGSLIRYVCMLIASIMLFTNIILVLHQIKWQTPAELESKTPSPCSDWSRQRGVYHWPAREFIARFDSFCPAFSSIHCTHRSWFCWDSGRAIASKVMSQSMLKISWSTSKLHTKKLWEISYASFRWAFFLWRPERRFDCWRCQWMCQECTWHTTWDSSLHFWRAGSFLQIAYGLPSPFNCWFLKELSNAGLWYG